MKNFQGTENVELWICGLEWSS